MGERFKGPSLSLSLFLLMKDTYYLADLADPLFAA
jgi:hypothetical protein